MGQFEYSNDRSQATVSFPAHKFPYTASVYYQCNVRLCALQDPSCQQVKICFLVYILFYYNKYLHFYSRQIVHRLVRNVTSTMLPTMDIRQLLKCSLVCTSMKMPKLLTVMIPYFPKRYKTVGIFLFASIVILMSAISTFVHRHRKTHCACHSERLPLPLQWPV